MSWRAESTFKPSSALTDEEKEFLKQIKKVREILKLEERASQGENLEAKQKEKLESKGKLLKEITSLAAKLPQTTELLDKNPDIADLLPDSAIKDIGKKRQREAQRLQQKAEREEQERGKPEFMDRHDRPILAVAVSKEDDCIFTCSKDKYAICWDMKDKLIKAICTFAGHTAAVWALDLLPRSETSPPLLATGDSDGKLLFWSAIPAKKTRGDAIASPINTVNNGGIIKVLRWCPFDLEADVKRLACCSDKLGSNAAAVRIWQVSGSRCKAQEALVLEKIPTRANDVQWGGGAKTKLFTAHDNGYIGVWLAEAPGTLLKTIKAHTAAVSCLLLTPDGSTLLTASHDSTSAAFDVTKASCDQLATYKANRSLNAVAVSTDFKAGESGTIVLAGGRDPMVVTRSLLLEDEFDVTVIDAKTSEAMAGGKGHIGPIHALLSLPWLGKYGGVASASEDACLLVHGFDGRILKADSVQ